MNPDELDALVKVYGEWEREEADAIYVLEAAGKYIAALRATEPAQVSDADREAAWKKLREYCTNGLPFYDNEDGWRAIANAVLRAANHRATEPAQVGDADREAAELWHNSPLYGVEALAQMFANHRALGRAEATAEIVAWLRTEPSVLFRHGPAIAPGAHCRDIADAIERGDHAGEGEG